MVGFDNLRSAGGTADRRTQIDGAVGVAGRVYPGAHGRRAGEHQVAHQNLALLEIRFWNVLFAEFEIVEPERSLGPAFQEPLSVV